MDNQSKAVLLGSVSAGLLIVPFVIAVAARGFRFGAIYPFLLLFAIAAGYGALQLWHKPDEE